MSEPNPQGGPYVDVVIPRIWMNGKCHTWLVTDRRAFAEEVDIGRSLGLTTDEAMQRAGMSDPTEGET